MARFLKEIEEISARQKQKGDLQHFNIRATQRQQAEIRNAGIQPIYVVPNLRWATPEFQLLRREGVIDNLIALNDPVKFPELYQVEHYFDRGHLNRSGAELFTRELARCFLDWQKQ